MQDRIDQGAARVSSGRVHDHSGRFIDNDYVTIFVNYING